MDVREGKIFDDDEKEQPRPWHGPLPVGQDFPVSALGRKQTLAREVELEAALR